MNNRLGNTRVEWYDVDLLLWGTIVPPTASHGPLYWDIWGRGPRGQRQQPYLDIGASGLYVRKFWGTQLYMQENYTSGTTSGLHGGFCTQVSGMYPISGYNLATKNYVDYQFSRVSPSLSGLIDVSGVWASGHVVGWNGTYFVPTDMSAGGGGGGGGVESSYIQFSATNTYQFDHGIGTYPVVQVLDSDYVQIESQVTHLSTSGLRLDFFGTITSGWIIYSAGVQTAEQGGFREQFTATTTYQVNHNLSGYPQVTILNSGLTEIEASVTHLSESGLRLDFFGTITSGWVLCDIGALGGAAVFNEGSGLYTTNAITHVGEGWGIQVSDSGVAVRRSHLDERYALSGSTGVASSGNWEISGTSAALALELPGLYASSGSQHNRLHTSGGTLTGGLSGTMGTFTTSVSGLNVYGVSGTLQKLSVRGQDTDIRYALSGSFAASGALYGNGTSGVLPVYDAANHFIDSYISQLDLGGTTAIVISDPYTGGSAALIPDFYELGLNRLYSMPPVNVGFGAFLVGSQQSGIVGAVPYYSEAALISVSDWRMPATSTLSGNLLQATSGVFIDARIKQLRIVDPFSSFAAYIDTSSLTADTTFSVVDSGSLGGVLLTGGGPTGYIGIFGDTGYAMGFQDLLWDQSQGRLEMGPGAGSNTQMLWYGTGGANYSVVYNHSTHTVTYDSPGATGRHIFLGNTTFPVVAVSGGISALGTFGTISGTAGTFGTLMTRGVDTDSRYALSGAINLTDGDARYVNVTGDTMTDSLYITGTNSTFFVQSGIRTSGKISLNSEGTPNSGVMLSDENVVGTGSVLRISCPSGWVKIGPQNSSFCHYQTDRGSNYFYQQTFFAANVILSGTSNRSLLHYPINSGVIGLIKPPEGTDTSRYRLGGFGTIQENNLGADKTSASNYRTIFARNAYTTNQAANQWAQDNDFLSHWKMEMGQTLTTFDFRASANGSEVWSGTLWSGVLAMDGPNRRVGINNVTNPQFDLHVSGTIYATNNLNTSGNISGVLGQFGTATIRGVDTDSRYALSGSVVSTGDIRVLFYGGF